MVDETTRSLHRGILDSKRRLAPQKSDDADKSYILFIQHGRYKSREGVCGKVGFDGLPYKGNVRLVTLHWLPSLGFRVLSASARLVACALALQIRSRDQERVRTRAEEPQTVTVAVGRTTKSQRVFAKE